MRYWRQLWRLLYTVLNSPSIIFILKRSETDLSSFEFARSPIFLYNQLYMYIIRLGQF